MSASALIVRDAAIIMWAVMWGLAALVLMAVGLHQTHWPWLRVAIGWTLAVAFFGAPPTVALVAHLIARKRPVRA